MTLTNQELGFQGLGKCSIFEHRFVHIHIPCYNFSK